MIANIGVLCALREHLSLVLRNSTPLILDKRGCLVEHHGQLWAIALQGRTSAISYENTFDLIETFHPHVLYTFGPAALVSGIGKRKAWVTADRCTRLNLNINTDESEITGECECGSSPNLINLKRAELLVSSDNFVADGQLVRKLAARQNQLLTLLDMGGYGVAHACAKAGIPWRHFRWVTDCAGDTAVSQFSQNVRELAKRGSEVVNLLEEVGNESCAIV